MDGSAENDGIARLLDTWMPWLTRDDLFASHHFAAGPRPGQGWKIHVSATPWSAPTVLERVLPIIVESGVGCKIVYSQPLLLLLNNGAYGPSQVGKFITLYPSCDDQAVQLAVEAHDATDGLAGPRVPSDRALRPGSLVHYRYGAFGRRWSARSDGGPPDAVADLLDRAGRLVPDRRDVYYAPPHDVVDPFEAAGAYVPPEPRAVPLAGRYLVVGVLAGTTYGGVYRAIDLAASPPRVCVLKEYWRDSGGDSSGRMAADWGRNEADLLARWCHDPSLPECFDCFELDGNLYVAIEYVEGRSLAAEIATRRFSGERFDLREVVSIGMSIGRALSRLHGKGIIYRDLNPSNIIVTPDGEWRLIDFGIAYESGSGAPPIGFGTLDFSSPAQWSGEEPSERDDVFSWGALLHALAGGRAGSTNPERPGASAGLPVERPALLSVGPQVPVEVAAVIDTAVAWRPSDRYSSMTEALGALTAASDELEAAPAGAPVTTTSPRAEREPDAPDPFARAASIAERLRRSAIERDGGACWASEDTTSGASFCSPDLYHGAAGVALFLAEFGRIHDDEPSRATARAAARWLAGPVWAAGRAEPGLYCGESGVGWFFIRLAEVLKEPGYLVAAELRARRLRGVSLEALDLVHGAAGLILFLVRLALATEKGTYLDDARAMGHALIDSACSAPRGAPGIYWSAPTHTSADPVGRASLGLAHGAAGIGLALTELAAASGDELALGAARNVGEMLLAQARPHPLGGWCWRESIDGEAMRMQGHCHGAIGIGQFFLRLARLDPDDRFRHAVRQAAVTAAREMPHRTSPGLCHGIAGDGNFLLDCHVALGDAHYLDQAKACAARLERHRAAAGLDGYPVNEANVSTPALLVGDAGIGWFSLRLAQPGLGRDAVLG